MHGDFDIPLTVLACDTPAVTTIQTQFFFSVPSISCFTGVSSHHSRAVVQFFRPSLCPRKAKLEPLKVYDSIKRIERCADEVLLHLFSGVAFLTGKLYVIGGHSPDGPLVSTERFDTKQQKWVTLNSLSMARFQLGACAVDGLVYAIGGRNNERSLDTVEVYDPKAKSWTLLIEKMAESRNDFGLAVRNHEIYCVGGRGVSSIESFDVVAKEWRSAGSTGENNFSVSCMFYPPMQ